MACTKLFEIQNASHGVQKGDGLGDGTSVTHPNEYYTKSRELVAEKIQSAAMEVDT